MRNIIVEQAKFTCCHSSSDKCIRPGKFLQTAFKMHLTFKNAKVNHTLKIDHFLSQISLAKLVKNFRLISCKKYPFFMPPIKVKCRKFCLLQKFATSLALANCRIAKRT